MFQRNMLTSEYIYLNILYQGPQDNVNFTSKNLASDKWKPAKGRQGKYDKAQQQTSSTYGMVMNNKYPLYLKDRFFSESSGTSSTM